MVPDETRLGCGEIRILRHCWGMGDGRGRQSLEGETWKVIRMSILLPGISSTKYKVSQTPEILMQIFWN